MEQYISLFEILAVDDVWIFREAALGASACLNIKISWMICCKGYMRKKFILFNFRFSIDTVFQLEIFFSFQRKVPEKIYLFFGFRLEGLFIVSSMFVVHFLFYARTIPFAKYIRYFQIKEILLWHVIKDRYFVGLFRYCTFCTVRRRDIHVYSK